MRLVLPLLLALSPAALANGERVEVGDTLIEAEPATPAVKSFISRDNLHKGYTLEVRSEPAKRILDSVEEEPF